MTKHAAAPSENWLALPAVTVPPSIVRAKSFYADTERDDAIEKEFARAQRYFRFWHFSDMPNLAGEVRY